MEALTAFARAGGPRGEHLHGFDALSDDVFNLEHFAHSTAAQVSSNRVDADCVSNFKAY